MLWICLHFPLLPLQVFTRAQAAEAEQGLSAQAVAPQALVISAARRVCRANPVALAAGVRPGQALVTATSLCQPLRIIERDPAREARDLYRLAIWCTQFTPMVNIQGTDALLLEAAGSLRLFKGLPSLLRRIDQGLGEMGYAYRLGLATTPKASQLLARAAGDQARQMEVADRNSPWLLQAPVAGLDLEAEQVEALLEMGIHRLEQLLALPTTALGKRFGADLLAYLQQLIGAQPDPRQPVQAENLFTTELFFLDGLDTTDALLFPIKRLLGELCQYLRSHQLYCRGCDWQLQQYDGKTYPLRIQLSQPEHRSETLLALTRLQLEQLKMHSSVHSIRLCAHDFTPARPQSRDLLDRRRQDAEAPEVLLDKLSTRLGRDALYGIEERQEGVPEYCWQPRPFNAGIKPRTRSKNRRRTHQVKAKPIKTPPTAPEPPRPAWLLPRPAPLQQRGEHLYWQGGMLTLVRGPERIDSHWWHKQPVQRDYFIARQENGCCYWIFRRLSDRRWFLQGLFA